MLGTGDEGINKADKKSPALLVTEVGEGRESALSQQHVRWLQMLYRKLSRKEDVAVSYRGLGKVSPRR